MESNSITEEYQLLLWVKIPVFETQHDFTFGHIMGETKIKESTDKKYF
jgi:hypothetical protein